MQHTKNVVAFWVKQNCFLLCLMMLQGRVELVLTASLMSHCHMTGLESAHRDARVSMWRNARWQQQNLVLAP